MAASSSQERLAFLQRLHDRVSELLGDVKFDKHPRKDGYLICLYASIIELAGGVALLISQDRMTSLSPVFRTLLEAYVDLKNVSADRSYVNHCFARHHKDWIRVLKHDQKPNPFLASIHGHDQRDELLAREESELQKLKEKGFLPLTVEERFEKAKMIDEYLSIYHFESDGIHNSWRALISRHLENAEDDFQLTLYKPHSLDRYDTYLDTTAALLLDATKTIHDQLGSRNQKEIETLDGQLKAISSKGIAP